MPTDLSEDQEYGARYRKSILSTEINFRRDRRQQIFSWSSSLLVAIIGGSTALGSAKQTLLAHIQSTGLYIAIIFLGVFSALWISHHYKKEQLLRQESQRYDQMLGLPESLDDSMKYDLANVLAILGLMVVDGRQPRNFTAQKLLEHSRLPLAWHDQRTVLGFC